MEQSGKVIIFDSEEEAKEWYEAIQDVIRHAKIEAARQRMGSWIIKMREYEKEPPQ